MNLRVVSWNIRYCRGQDGEHVWSHRFPRVRKALRSVKPDLMALQEVLPHQRRDLEQEFEDYRWYGLGRYQDFSDEQCPVAVSKRFEVLGSTNFWLSGTPEQPGSVGWDACLPRICTAVWLQSEGKRLVITSTHFDHLGSQARKRSAELVRSILCEENTIVAGDLNCGPSSRPIKCLKEHFQDAAADLARPEPTFHDFGRLASGPTIDYILFRTFAKESFQVMKEEGPEFGSDHFALVADLRV